MYSTVTTLYTVLTMDNCGIVGLHFSSKQGLTLQRNQQEIC